jgi:hypothetical protein
MILLIYIPTREIDETQLTLSIGEWCPQFQIERFETFGDFQERLKKPRCESTCAMLFAPDKQDLVDLLSIQHLFRNVPIILIISARNHDTISMAHRLRPRFLSYFAPLSTKINLEEILAVLKKMSQTYGLL